MNTVNYGANYTTDETKIEALFSIFFNNTGILRFRTETSYSSIYRYTTKIKAETQDRENKCYNINQLKDLIAISNKNSALEEYKLWFFETSARQN